MSTRTCLDCGVGIDHRAPTAKRCEEHGAAHRRESQRLGAARRYAERHKRPEGAPPRAPAMPGETFGELTLLERIAGKGRGMFRCSCGNVKELKVANVTLGMTTNCADRTKHPNPRLVERPAYSTAHQRVRAARGPAKDHACIVCGEQAHDWAYLGSDPDQLIEQGGREDGYVYSTKPEHYAPMCRKRGCHQRYDEARAKAAPRHTLSLAHVAFQAVLSSAAA